MTEYDVQLVLQKARELYPDENPTIISDNGSQFLAKDFKEFIRINSLQHIRTSVGYPQSNGKIESFHKSIKAECIHQQSFISIEDACRKIDQWIEEYNFVRLHSAIGYISPNDKLHGRAEQIFKERDQKLQNERERRKTNNRRNQSRIFLPESLLAYNWRGEGKKMLVKPTNF